MRMQSRFVQEHEPWLNGPEPQRPQNMPVMAHERQPRLRKVPHVVPSVVDTSWDEDRDRDIVASPAEPPWSPSASWRDGQIAREEDTLSERPASPLAREDDPLPERRGCPLVHLQVCGRVESLELEPQTVQAACALARKAFDLSADQPLELTDREGTLLSTDSVLQKAVARDETIYLRPSEGALHEFERRVDELQHMQLGYFCDQFATFRQEYSDIRAEVAGLRITLGQEQTKNDAAADTLWRETEEARNVALRCSRQCEEKQKTLEKAWETMQQDVHGRSLHGDHDASRQIQGLREAVALETNAREHIAVRVRNELEEFRRILELESRDREDCETRLEGLIQDVRNTVTELSDSHQYDLGDVRSQCQQTLEAIALEQRERVAGSGELSSVVEGLRKSLASESRGRAEHFATLSSRFESLDISVEALMLSRRQGFTELTQQLGVAVEGLQEEQRLRSSEDAELTRSVETLRRNVLEARQKADTAELTAGRVVHDLSKLLEEETRSRDLEIARLHRAVSEEQNIRQEEDAKSQRMVTSFHENFINEGERRSREVRDIARRIDACSADVEVERKERLAVSERLSEQVTCQPRQTGEDDSYRDLKDAHQRQADTMRRLENEFEAHRTELNGMQSRRPDSLDSPDQHIQSTIDEKMGDLRDSVMELVQGDLQAFREGLTKVVDAVQQERRSRSESYGKLRDDVRDAVHNEVNSRVEQGTRLENLIEVEARARQEALALIERLLADCRQGLETHSHDLTVAGSGHDESGGSLHRGGPRDGARSASRNPGSQQELFVRADEELFLAEAEARHEHAVVPDFGHMPTSPDASWRHLVPEAESLR